MATQEDLNGLGFCAAELVAKRLSIVFPNDPKDLGPFCRLLVDDDAPNMPGVYAWVVNDAVMYVGMSGELVQVVHGQRLGRAFNDYTYMPASKVASQPHSPRVRVNGELNRTLVAGHRVTWWWLETPTVAHARDLEARLILEWSPAWNRARPVVVDRTGQPSTPAA